jgi:hypothetical protein
MIFVFDGLYDLEVTYDYDDYADDAPVFTFTNDNGYKIVIGYWSIKYGGHQRSIRNYQNDQYHGTQYRWYSIQGGGHIRCIENYQNDQKHGIQHYWRQDGSYYTKVY